jgi:hypothetical protein
MTVSPPARLEVVEDESLRRELAAKLVLVYALAANCLSDGRHVMTLKGHDVPRSWFSDKATREKAARVLGVAPDAGILEWPSFFRRCQNMHDGMLHVADVTSGASPTTMMAQELDALTISEKDVMRSVFMEAMADIEEDLVVLSRMGKINTTMAQFGACTGALHRAIGAFSDTESTAHRFPGGHSIPPVITLLGRIMLAFYCIVTAYTIGSHYTPAEYTLAVLFEFFVTLAFCALFRVATFMSEPFGSDYSDLELSQYGSALAHDVNRILQLRKPLRLHVSAGVAPESIFKSVKSKVAFVVNEALQSDSDDDEEGVLSNNSEAFDDGTFGTE